ncbi:MAG: V-type ATP synthase subunit D [Eubacteriales bacterium]|jgi:V/A-type H+-transporting ATPase subunit D
MAGIVPTKSNLMAAQKSLKLAKLGYELMDRKKNILIKELLSLAADAKTIRADTEKAFSEAYESLRHAEMTLGRCGTFAMSVPVDDGLSLSAHSVMGVELPDIRYKEQKSYPYFGFDCTNAYLDEAYRSFNKAKALAVKLAAVENNVCRLADAVKKTQKRANALSNVQIPTLTARIKFITEALDEKEREDFSRLKLLKSTEEKASEKE